MTETRKPSIELAQPREENPPNEDHLEIPELEELLEEYRAGAFKEYRKLEEARMSHRQKLALIIATSSIAGLSITSVLGALALGVGSEEISGALTGIASATVSVTHAGTYHTIVGAAFGALTIALLNRLKNR